MPWSNWGTGTMHYGKRDFWPDGSYITTEFIAIFGVAVVPVRSLRVKHIEAGYDIDRVSLITEYVERSRSRPNWKQVASIYSFEALLGAFVFGYPLLVVDRHRYTSEWILMGGFVLGIGLISAIPTALRRIGRKNPGTHD